MIKTESMIKTEVKPHPYTPISSSSSCPPLSGATFATQAAAGSGAGKNSRSSIVNQLKAKAKAVVLRCWRNRVSPVQFSIEMKKMISDESNRSSLSNNNNNGSAISSDSPSSSSTKTPKITAKDVIASSKTYVGDAFDLAEILFRQCFCGQAPNRLILSYLNFCLGGGVVSFKETLRLATTPSTGSGGIDAASTPLAIDISRPECLKALLQLVENFANCLVNVDKANDSVEDCMENTRVLAKTVDWIVTVLERVAAKGGSANNLESAVRDVIDAARKSLKRVVEDEPVLAALAKIGILEAGPEMEARISRNAGVIIDSSLATSSSADDKGATQTFKDLLTKTAKLASMPASSSTKTTTKKEHDDDDDRLMNSQFDKKKTAKVEEETPPPTNDASTGGPLEEKTLSLPISVLTFVEVVLNTSSSSNVRSSERMSGVNSFTGETEKTRGVDVLAQVLELENVLRVSRVRIVSQLVRAAFLGIVDAKDNEGAIADKCLGDGHRGSGEELKWFAFLMLKLPEMLRQMNSAPSTDGTPSKGAVFKGLRLFLSSTSLVDLADRKTQADTALLFLQQLTRPKYGVLSEEERTELLRRRFHGNNPNITDTELKETHTVVKGERTCEQIINTLSQELTHNEAPILGVMSHMGFGESIKVVFAAAAATGKLPLFVSQVVRLNEHCRVLTDSKASAGAACLSFPVLLDRALLYDLSFSTLCYIVLLYGPGVLSAAHNAVSHAHILQWMRLHFPSNSRPKNVDGTGMPAPSSDSSSSSSPDSLLQQLMNTNGVSLSPPHSRLSDHVDATPFAIRELVLAWESGAINAEVVMSCLEKLKAFSCLPIAAAAWLLAYIRLQPTEKTEKPIFMLQQLLSFGSTPPGNLPKDFAKYYAERTRIAQQVLTRIHHDLTASHVANFHVEKYKLTQEEQQARNHEASSKTGMINASAPSPTTSADALKAIFQNCIQRGWVDIRDTHQLHRLLQVGGCRWFANQTVDLLLSQFYQNDIMMSTNLLYSWFCLRRQALTSCLVGETIPALLDRGGQSLEDASSGVGGSGGSASAMNGDSSANPNVQNPHAFALARLAVLCLAATLVERNSTEETNLKKKLGSKRKSQSSDIDLDLPSPNLPPRKRIQLDSSSPFPLSKLLSSTASAFPPPFSKSSSTSSSHDDDDDDDIKPSMSDIKIKVEGAVVDPSRSTSGSSGDAASEEVDDVFHSSLTRMFDAFLRAVDRGTVDARILFIHEFLVQLLKTRHCEEILPFIPVRLASKLLSIIPRELSADIVTKLNHLHSSTGRGVAASLLHVYASALRD